MKKTICMLVCILMLMGACMSGCVLDGGNAEPTAVPAANIDPTLPVLTMGNHSISFAIYNALYDSYLPYMQYTGYDPLSSIDMLESFQDWIIDSLANDIVVLYEADVNGYVLNEEQETRLAEELEQELQDLYDEYYSLAEEDYETNSSVSVGEYFEKYINQVSEYYTGVSMSWAEYQEEYGAEKRRSFIIQEYKEYVTAEFTPTNSDVTSWYDTEYDSDKTNYTSTPGAYKVDQEYYEANYGLKDDAYPPTYVPTGYSRMMHIIVTPEGELSEEYATKLSRMEEIRTEYCELAFEDAVNVSDANAEAMAALMDEYFTLKAETDQEFAEYSQAALEKINQAYAALEAGQPFSDVMVEYTEDVAVVGSDDVNGCVAFQQKGQLISQEYSSTSDWSAGVKAEFGKLSIGDYSEVFIDGGSYHIIYYVGDETAGDVELQSIYNVISEIIADDVRDKQWQALIEEWKNDPNLVKDMELIRALGKDDVTEG